MFGIFKIVFLNKTSKFLLFNHSFRFFHALFKKLWDKQKKNTFLLFINYLKTENRKNSEKNDTNVSLDSQFQPKLTSDANFCQTAETYLYT